MIEQRDCSAYLMAYFGPLEKLYFAYSTDAITWRPIHPPHPIFEISARVRDPYLCRVKNKFHLVHTIAWDHPMIAHWESPDLCHWQGKPLHVVPKDRLRAWAPEFTYVPQEDLIYLYWSSQVQDRNVMHYVTTQDFNDITPERAAVYYDIGTSVIDLTITPYQDRWVAFHKPGTVEDMFNNLMLTTTNLDPRIDGFANRGHGKDVLHDASKPIEGPEVIKVIGENRWYVYADCFHAPMEGWVTTDFVTFTKIPVHPPQGAKHCSMIPITQTELHTVLRHFDNSPAPAL